MIARRRSWPIGYARPGIEIEASPSGTVFANGEPIADGGGWIMVPAPDARPAGAPGAIHVRIHVARDGAGEPQIFARETRLGATLYPGLHDLAIAEALAWISFVPRAVLAEITQRAAASRAVSRSIVIPGRAALLPASGGAEAGASVHPAAAASGGRGRHDGG